MGSETESPSKLTPKGELVDAARGLGSALGSFSSSLTPPERNNLRLVLCMAAGELAGATATAPGTIRDEALRATVGCLTRLQPHGARVPSTGILWYGRASWMTDSMLDELRAEAESQRPSAILYGRQYLAYGGPQANTLAMSANLVALAEQYAGKVRPTGVASYLYYDAEGLGIDPHVDTDVFALNALIMLRHDVVSTRNSCLSLYPPGGSTVKLDLAPGEMVLLFADSVVHGRDSVTAGETVHVLTVGMRPADTQSYMFTL